MNDKIISSEYNIFVRELKNQIEASRYKAVRAVNCELILLYHHIGTEILKRQSTNSWGTKIIDQLSKDLKSLFPEIKGFGSRNLNYMRKFAEQYYEIEFVQQVAAQLPWFHIVTIMEKVAEKQNQIFYMGQALENGWSRNILTTQIKNNLHIRQGQALNNFQDKLISPQSYLASQALKDPYIFDFLSMGEEAHEREIEKGLISHVEKFLLELGAGFSFVGRQYHLEVGEQDFYIDLLFYHLKLRCFVVIELKNTEFRPEYAGKMNFYLSVVDDLIKHRDDNSSIGLILCKSKNNVLAEYTLKDMSKPIGLAEYKINESLPEKIKTALPSIKELEAELMKIEDLE
jgi:predicted nuclease of restriction endonuclease-like (RecB) superfamily